MKKPMTASEREFFEQVKNLVVTKIPYLAINGSVQQAVAYKRWVVKAQRELNLKPTYEMAQRIKQEWDALNDPKQKELML